MLTKMEVDYPLAVEIPLMDSKYFLTCGEYEQLNISMNYSTWIDYYLTETNYTITSDKGDVSGPEELINNG